MKRLRTLRLALAALIGGYLASCSFLDVVPDGTPKEDDMFSSSLQLQQYLNGIYGYMPYTMSFRQMPDLCAGGDLISGTNGISRYYPYKSILYQEENASNTYFALWDPLAPGMVGRLSFYIVKGIRNSWNIIRNIDKVPDLTETDRNSYLGEAYFLVGYYHWLLMEYYGPVPVIDHLVPVGAPESETLLPRASWDTCADFVAAMFDQAAALLPANWVNSELGRATSVAAKALKARCLMYSASPMVNGNPAYADFLNYDDTPLVNPTYDREKWKRALDATRDAIESAEKAGYRLFTDPHGDGWSDAERGRNNYYQCFLQHWNDTEYLWATGYTWVCQQLQLYGPPRQWDASRQSYTGYGFRGYLTPTLQLVETYLTDKGLPLWADPDTKDAYAATRLLDIAPGDSTARLHRHRDPRFYATVGFDRGRYIYNGDTVTLHMRAKEAHGYTLNAKHEYNSCTGYVLQKYVSIATSYNDVTKQMTYFNEATPVVRLAELYLDFAEAQFEYTGSLDAEGLACLDKVRARAGLPGFADSWSLAGGIPTGETLRRVLHQENMSELACEGRQYHNIRRWNIAADVMGVAPDNLNISGKTAADFYKIVKMRENGTRVYENPKTNWLAVPMSQLDINYKLVQNPGY